MLTDLILRLERCSEVELAAVLKFMDGIEAQRDARDSIDSDVHHLAEFAAQQPTRCGATPAASMDLEADSQPYAVIEIGGDG
jgi:hypothetical protein